VPQIEEIKVVLVAAALVVVGVDQEHQDKEMPAVLQLLFQVLVVAAPVRQEILLRQM
jgi:hypothetical protein